MANKYNDGLNNETEVQIMSTYRRPPSTQTKRIISDLGTLKQFGSDKKYVMYSDNSNLNLNLNMNTLHMHDNESGCARVTPSEAFGPLAAEKEITREKDVGSTTIRDLTSDLDIVQIEVQMGKIKEGKYKRADVYISMMTMDDKLYTIKLTSDVTNAWHEIRRSCRKKQYWADKVEEIISVQLDNCMIGRARYKITKNRPLHQTKPNLGNVLVVYCTENNLPTILLYLFTDDPIYIPLNKQLTPSQKKYYEYAGQYNKELEDL